MKSILWVEDEKDQFRTFSSIFKKNKDYKVTRAVDFEDALEKIENNSFDLYIIDILLPSGRNVLLEEEIDEVLDKYYGIELIRELRNRRDETPIIVVSVVNEQSFMDTIKGIDPKIEVIWKYDTESRENIRDVVKQTLEK